MAKHKKRWVKGSFLSLRARHKIPRCSLLDAVRLGVTWLSLSLLASCYVSSQVWHHGKLLSERQKIDEIVESPSADVTVKTKLKLVKQVLKFAEKEGLNVEDSYEYFVDTKSPVVSYLVQAAYADRLEMKTWWFPIVGHVPYLGFYEKAERDQLADELAREGFDVKRGAAGAFSSLGWFQDPLFSSMIQRSDADLVHLLLHELTHRTIWVPDSTEFNENLAEYVGHTLTLKYLAQNHLNEQKTTYTEDFRDREKFRIWLMSLKKALEVLYSQRIDKDEMLKKKALVFSRFQAPPLKPKFVRSDYVGGQQREWNNASVLAAALYAPDTDRFKRAHRCFHPKESKLVHFFKELELRLQVQANPFAALDSFCKQGKLQ